MNRKRNIAINALLNVIKSSLSILFPLITYPYVLRVLGAEGIGKVNYSASIVSYFSMLAVLGVSSYGVREGAKLKEDPNRFKTFINEVFTVNILSTVVAYFALAIILGNVPKLQPYSTLIALQSASMIFTTLGLDWINIIYEDFFLITVRSIVVYIISFILLFSFVKDNDDYYIYALLTIIGNIIVCISNWFYVRRYVKPKFTNHPRIRVHLKPMLLMFSNHVATSIYVNFDTTILGWLHGDLVVGLYSVAVKVYGIVKGILVAIYAVAVPRLASYFGSGDFERYQHLYTSLWKYLTILLLPSSVGLACVSSEIMEFMGGVEYLPATLSLQILSVALVFAIYGGLVTAVLNITIGRERDNLYATMISAAINLGLNFVFIPLYSLNGAAITTCISEMFVLVFCLLRNKDLTKYLELHSVGKDIIDAGLGSLLIIVVAISCKCLISCWLPRLITIVCLSIVTYVGFMMIRGNQSCKILYKIVKRKLQRE